MYVPNYIPDPIEIPENVTEEPYQARLAFVRRVQIWHFLSLLSIGAIASIPNHFPVIVSGICFGGVLLALAILRVCLRKAKWEARVSTLLLVPLILSAGLVMHGFQRIELPIWTIIFGPACALIYALLCGRDHSFVGQFLLSLIASSTIIAAMSVAAPDTVANARFALIANAAYLSYFVYDLASLLARRRLNEALAAVVDLYRDVFNIFGYVVRCIRHWRKHRIFVIPR